MFNPIEAAISNSAAGVENKVSTSALVNDIVGQCPKCKNTFGHAIVDGAEVFYCESCRVAAPTPDNVVG